MPQGHIVAPDCLFAIDAEVTRWLLDLLHTHIYCVYGQPTCIYRLQWSVHRSTVWAISYSFELDRPDDGRPDDRVTIAQYSFTPHAISIATPPAARAADELVRISAHGVAVPHQVRPLIKTKAGFAFKASRQSKQQQQHISSESEDDPLTVASEPEDDPGTIVSNDDDEDDDATMQT